MNRSLYEQQLNEIDLLPNYKRFLDVVFNTRPKQIHTGALSDPEKKRAYMKHWWQVKGKQRRLERRHGVENNFK